MIYKKVVINCIPYVSVLDISLTTKMYSPPPLLFASGNSFGKKFQKIFFSGEGWAREVILIVFGWADKAIKTQISIQMSKVAMMNTKNNASGPLPRRTLKITYKDILKCQVDDHQGVSSKKRKGQTWKPKISRQLRLFDSIKP